MLQAWSPGNIVERWGKAPAGESRGLRLCMSGPQCLPLTSMVEQAYNLSIHGGAGYNPSMVVQATPALMVVQAITPAFMVVQGYNPRTQGAEAGGWRQVRV